MTKGKCEKCSSFENVGLYRQQKIGYVEIVFYCLKCIMQDTICVYILSSNNREFKKIPLEI